MQIAEIAGSNLLVDWIGLPLILHPERNGAFDTIRLLGVQSQRARSLSLAGGWAPVRSARRRWLHMLLITLLLIAAFYAVSIINSVGIGSAWASTAEACLTNCPPCSTANELAVQKPAARQPCAAPIIQTPQALITTRRTKSYELR